MENYIEHFEHYYYFEYKFVKDYLSYKVGRVIFNSDIPYGILDALVRRGILQPVPNKVWEPREETEEEKKISEENMRISKLWDNKMDNKEEVRVIKLRLEEIKAEEVKSNKPKGGRPKGSKNKMQNVTKIKTK